METRYSKMDDTMTDKITKYLKGKFDCNNVIVTDYAFIIESEYFSHVLCEINGHAVFKGLLINFSIEPSATQPDIFDELEKLK